MAGTPGLVTAAWTEWVTHWTFHPCGTPAHCSLPNAHLVVVVHWHFCKVEVAQTGPCIHCCLDTGQSESHNGPFIPVARLDPVIAMMLALKVTESTILPSSHWCGCAFLISMPWAELELGTDWHPVPSVFGYQIMWYLLPLCSQGRWWWFGLMRIWTNWTWVMGVSFQTSGVDNTKSGHQTKLAETTQWYYYNQDQQLILFSTMDISLDTHSFNSKICFTQKHKFKTATISDDLTIRNSSQTILTKVKLSFLTLCGFS